MGRGRGRAVSHGVVALVRAGALPSFVEAVAGEPVRGSWWGHPRGNRIYNLAEGLEASGEVISAKLVDGKVCFVHRALWPALLRTLGDPALRAARSAGLSNAARHLVEVVTKEGRLRAPREAPKAELEASLLVHVGQEHTETGAHATVLSTWSSVLGAADDGLSLEAARAALSSRGVTLDAPKPTKAKAEAKPTKAKANATKARPPGRKKPTPRR